MCRLGHRITTLIRNHPDLAASRAKVIGSPRAGKLGRSWEGAREDAVNVTITAILE